MAQQALWVPGYVAQVQTPGFTNLLQVGFTPYSDVMGLREGNGIRFRCRRGTSTWFHLAIPTPVITDGVRARLDKFFVLYSLDSGAVVQQVQVYDGPNLVRNYPALAYTGDHSTTLDAQNTWAGGGGALAWGVGISVMVRAALTADANLRFTTAGADFLVP